MGIMDVMCVIYVTHAMYVKHVMCHVRKTCKSRCPISSHLISQVRDAGTPLLPPLGGHGRIQQRLYCSELAASQTLSAQRCCQTGLLGTLAFVSNTTLAETLLYGRCCRRWVASHFSARQASLSKSAVNQCVVYSPTRRFTNYETATPQSRTQTHARPAADKRLFSNAVVTFWLKALPIMC